MVTQPQIPAVPLRLSEGDLLFVIVLLPHEPPPRVRDRTVSVIHKPFRGDDQRWFVKIRLFR
jgi:hypothetical protein